MKLSVPENTSILISRTDSIGDVILSIPLTAALKKKYPNNKIIFLATSYTKAVLQYIKTVDEVIDFNEISKLNTSGQKKVFENYNIHLAIVAFPNFEVTKFLYKMKVPYRIATSHRWYNWLFCNQLISFSRKNSDLHESQLNFHLLKPLGFQIPDLNEISLMYQLKKIPDLPIYLKSQIDSSKFRLILHPKSKGSAREWSIDNYIQLIKKLDLSKFQIIITGTQNELPALQKIFSECPETLNFVGKTNLQQLISLINECDALVAASTGTLHIAAILGKHSIGIFPPIKPMHPGRWAPLGKHTHIFCVNKTCSDCRKNPYSCACIQQITAEEIAALLNTLQQNKND